MSTRQSRDQGEASTAEIVEIRLTGNVFLSQLYHSEYNKTKIEHDIELTKEIVNRFQTGVLRHNLEFASVYENVENFVSTYHRSWILVDYMFYSAGQKDDKDNPELKLLSYLELPSAETCESIGLKIPNNYLGSDHLSIAARFFLASSQPTSTKL